MENEEEGKSVRAATDRHLSDGTGQLVMHVPLGKGKVDFKACIEEIKKSGYDGYWSLNAQGYSFPEHALKVAKKMLGTLI
ncbi:MAG: hypothetical protein HXY48_01880 [Ignavibacteriaceae bacterium]|nr:hypothetical protein [Ignavibacteriaceae bacterium]